MKQQLIFSGDGRLSSRKPNCLMTKSLSSLLAGGVLIIAGLNMSVASAATLTEAAALLNIQSPVEASSLARDAANLLRDYDSKSDMPNRVGALRQDQSTVVDESVIPFLSNLVESIAHGKAQHKKAPRKKAADVKVVNKKVMHEIVAVKSESIVVRRVVKVNKLPVVKQWAGLNRTHPELSYAKALLKKAAAAKLPAVLQILPKVTEIKKAKVQYSIKQ